ncbi:hypothetical protein [Staphylococcus nepalensis]
MDTISEVITVLFSKEGGLILVEKLPLIMAGALIGILIKKITNRSEWK